MPVESRIQARRRGEVLEKGPTAREALQARSAPYRESLERTAVDQGLAPDVQNQVAENVAAEVNEAAQTASAMVDMAQGTVDFEPNPINNRQLDQQVFGSDIPGIGNMARGAEMASQGLAMEAAAGAAAADAEAQALGEAATQIATENNRASERLELLNVKMQEISEKAMNLNTRLAELQIDPNRFWNNRTTAQKAMLMLGAGLTSFGGGDGFGMIMGLIDRDVMAQQEEYNRMGGEVKNMVSMMSQLYGPGKDAILMSRSFALETLKAQVEAKIAATKSPQIRAEGLKAIGMFDIEIGRNYNQVANDSIDRQLRIEESAKLGADTQIRLAALDQAEQALSSLESQSVSGARKRGILPDSRFQQAFAQLRDAMVTQAGMDESSFNQMMRPRFGESSENFRARVARMRQIIERKKSTLSQVQGRVNPPTRNFELPRFNFTQGQ